MHSPLLTALYNWRQQHEGLDAIKHIEALRHDLVHAVLGLGVDLASEEVVLNCYELFCGRECSSHMVETCTEAIASANTELVSLLIDFLN